MKKIFLVLLSVILISSCSREASNEELEQISKPELEINNNIQDLITTEKNEVRIGNNEEFDALIEDNQYSVYESNNFTFQYLSEWSSETKGTIWGYYDITSEQHTNFTPAHSQASTGKQPFVMIKSKIELNEDDSCEEKQEYITKDDISYSICINTKQARGHDMEFDVYQIYQIEDRDIKLEYLINSNLNDEIKVKYANILNTLIDTIK